jgi:hypothetical protein
VIEIKKKKIRRRPCRRFLGVEISEYRNIDGGGIENSTLEKESLFSENPFIMPRFWFSECYFAISAAFYRLFNNFLGFLHGLGGFFDSGGSCF